MALRTAAKPSRSRGSRVVVLVAVAGLAVAACGSRLPDDVLASIDDATFGDGDAASGQSGTARGVRPSAGESSDTGSGDVDASAAAAPGATTPGSGQTASVGLGDGSDGGDGPCSGGATDVGVTADEVVVAAMVTASGPLPGATEGQFRGAAAYFAKVNAEGGVCGRQIRILKGDDGLDPQRARGEFLRLEPQVLAFVGSLAVADSGYVDLAESTGVPYIGTFVDPAGRRLPNTEPRSSPNVAHSGPYVYYRQAHPEVTRVGFMYADVGGVRANTPGAIAGFERSGYDIVYNSGASATAPDFTAEVINLRSAGAQLVYLFAFEVNMHVRFARNMRQQNWEPEVKVSQIGYNSRLVDLLGETANGWSNHLTYVPVINEGEESISPALAEFRQWHDATFPGAQIDLFPVNGWRDAALFVEALRAAGPDVTRARILEIIRGIEESDGGGLFAPFSPARGEGASCFVIVRVEQERWVREYPAAGYECDMGERYEF